MPYKFAGRDLTNDDFLLHRFFPLSLPARAPHAILICGPPRRRILFALFQRFRVT